MTESFDWVGIKERRSAARIPHCGSYRQLWTMTIGQAIGQLLAAGHPSSQFPQNFDPEPENIMKVSMFANYLNNLSIYLVDSVMHGLK